jgi:hypothetical protein
LLRRLGERARVLQLGVELLPALTLARGDEQPPLVGSGAGERQLVTERLALGLVEGVEGAAVDLVTVREGDEAGRRRARRASSSRPDTTCPKGQASEELLMFFSI